MSRTKPTKKTKAPAAAAAVPRAEVFVVESSPGFRATAPPPPPPERESVSDALVDPTGLRFVSVASAATKSQALHNRRSSNSKHAAPLLSSWPLSREMVDSLLNDVLGTTDTRDGLACAMASATRADGELVFPLRSGDGDDDMSNMRIERMRLHVWPRMWRKAARTFFSIRKGCSRKHNPKANGAGTFRLLVEWQRASASRSADADGLNDDSSSSESDEDSSSSSSSSSGSSDSDVDSEDLSAVESWLPTSDALDGVAQALAAERAQNALLRGALEVGSKTMSGLLDVDGGSDATLVQGGHSRMGAYDDTPNAVESGTNTLVLASGATAFGPSSEAEEGGFAQQEQTSEFASAEIVGGLSVSEALHELNAAGTAITSAYNQLAAADAAASRAQTPPNVHLADEESALRAQIAAAQGAQAVLSQASHAATSPATQATIAAALTSVSRSSDAAATALAQLESKAAAYAEHAASSFQLPPPSHMSPLTVAASQPSMSPSPQPLQHVGSPAQVHSPPTVQPAPSPLLLSPSVHAMSLIAPPSPTVLHGGHEVQHSFEGGAYVESPSVAPLSPLQAPVPTSAHSPRGQAPSQVAELQQVLTSIQAISSRLTSFSPSATLAPSTSADVSGMLAEAHAALAQLASQTAQRMKALSAAEADTAHRLASASTLLEGTERALQDASTAVADKLPQNDPVARLGMSAVHDVDSALQAVRLELAGPRSQHTAVTSALHGGDAEAEDAQVAATAEIAEIAEADAAAALSHAALDAAALADVEAHARDVAGRALLATDATADAIEQLERQEVELNARDALLVDAVAAAGDVEAAVALEQRAADASVDREERVERAAAAADAVVTAVAAASEHEAEVLAAVEEQLARQEATAVQDAVVNVEIAALAIRDAPEQTQRAAVPFHMAGVCDDEPSGPDFAFAPPRPTVTAAAAVVVASLDVDGGSSSPSPRACKRHGDKHSSPARPSSPQQRAVSPTSSLLWDAMN
jgi:hypothetical protein